MKVVAVFLALAAAAHAASVAAPLDLIDNIQVWSLVVVHQLSQIFSQFNLRSC